MQAKQLTPQDVRDAFETLKAAGLRAENCIVAIRLPKSKQHQPKPAGYAICTLKGDEIDTLWGVGKTEEAAWRDARLSGQCSHAAWVLAKEQGLHVMRCSQALVDDDRGLWHGYKVRGIICTPEEATSILGPEPRDPSDDVPF